MEEKKEKPVLNFLMKTLNGMAYGLFATLIVGTIFATIGKLFGYGAETSKFCAFMLSLFNGHNDGTSNWIGMANILQNMTGAGIGVGIALALKFDPLKTIVLAAVGEIAACTSLGTTFITSGGNIDHLAFKFQVGDPLTIYLVCIGVAIAMKYIIRKKTPVDIIIIPLFGVAAGTLISLGIRYPAISVTYAIQWLVDSGTKAVPFVAGMVVAVLMGMALTAPISSAAIAAMIFSIPKGGNIADYQGLILASGAAVVGCSCQMIGFAVQSRKDNNVGTVISIGIGTSMLQFKNILKKPVIWLPTIIASAILGPISTCWLKLACIGGDISTETAVFTYVGSSAGMGTAGLVGQIGTIDSMGVANWQVWVGIFGLMIILPGVLVFFIDLLFRKLGWIKEGDLTV
ncbi:MAG: PTS sugar transporter subunit IIC [Bacilli bacterium]|nr:PTS sugar transporter subunit IIC [Bacilli bacterium]